MQWGILDLPPTSTAEHSKYQGISAPDPWPRGMRKWGGGGGGDLMWYLGVIFEFP